MKKVYVVICYDYSASGGNRFQDVRIFDSLEKANHFAAYKCNGKVYDYAEVEEIEVE